MKSNVIDSVRDNFGKIAAVISENKTIKAISHGFMSITMILKVKHYSTYFKIELIQSYPPY